MAIANLQPLAYAVAYVTFFIGLTLVGLRAYCHIKFLKTWRWDDLWATAILIFIIGQQIVLHMFLYWGCGLHMDTLSPVQQYNIGVWLFVEEVVYYAVHWIIKMSFLAFYLRLSPIPTFRKLIFFGMVLNAAIFLTNTLTAFFQCVPFDEIFHPGTHPGAVCINRLALLVVPSVLNILEDVYILVLPVSTVWNLQMTTRRKVAVLSVISFGASAVIVACFRLIPLLELYGSPDVSWALGKMVIVASLEIQLAVVASNLPSMKALWLHMTSESANGSGGEQSGSKGYKLSSMERKGAGSRFASHKRGSITMMERGVMSTESEEELTRVALSTSGSKVAAEG
ncbi:hypothetical protein P171DRAFT_468887 [Karstenula rhodostoma CBS 690.94]|uniref:Rhodopsin domain-containing protein n=1 Tax=Karstenula rhodostoma CBS 690.94 TaxID=1392251 RepID=A0A9P4PWI2_9PLEO|nr:hypothetical protein P171DRAFT_468887 [Karstenula rhodostoma CBS 690.94]